MGQYNLEGVRQVAIDEDWSAQRFRKIAFIKKFSRQEKMALSQEGKKELLKKVNAFLRLIVLAVFVGFENPF
jgi:hypothetical protein